MHSIYIATYAFNIIFLSFIKFHMYLYKHVVLKHVGLHALDKLSAYIISFLIVK